LQEVCEMINNRIEKRKHRRRLKEYFISVNG